MSQTATIVPTAAIAERWEATTPVTGDYARDCAELAREALSHVGFTRFEDSVPPCVLDAGRGPPDVVCINAPRFDVLRDGQQLALSCSKLLVHRISPTLPLPLRSLPPRAEGHPHASVRQC